jgi:hypothetical protein
VSIEVLSWVLNHADVKDTGELAVLVGIANHVDRTGRGSFAGQATLARYARCSERTVRRKLAELEARGAIARGDQRIVEHFPASTRPVVWDVIWPGQNDRAASLSGGRGDSVSTTGGQSVQSARTRVADNTSNEPLDEPSLKDLAGAVDFGTFWAAYPRHEKRAEALKAWGKAIKRAAPAAIIAGAQRYAADPNRLPAYTAHPASWLNGDRWEDDPLPARSDGRASDVFAAELAAAQAADSAEAAALVAELEAGRPW